MNINFWTNKPTISIWLLGEYTSMNSNRFGYSECEMLLSTLNLKDQSIIVCERATVTIYIQFNAVHTNKVSEIILTFIRFSCFGIGMDVVCQTWNSYLYHLVWAVWALNTLFLWAVAKWPKFLIFLHFSPNNREANVWV